MKLFIKEDSPKKKTLYGVFDNYEYDELVDKEVRGWLDYIYETSSSRITNEMILDSFLDQGVEFVPESEIDPEIISDDSYFIVSTKDICSDVKQRIRDLRY